MILSDAARGHLARVNGIDIWYETFGEKGKETILLIMGALCQGILWPREFCQKLADLGYLVIRYDHRDTGLSTYLDYSEQPYNLVDMAKDGIGLLKHLRVEKAHLIGISMGGPIAELISHEEPSLVSSLTLLATSSDYRPCLLANSNNFPKESTLSPPKKIYLDWLRNYSEFPPCTLYDKIEERVSRWKILHGSLAPFEENYYRQLFGQFFSRQKNGEISSNHYLAMINSFEQIRLAPHDVKVPTVILQGSEDPIFSEDHGLSLHAAIPHSKYILVKGMGHIPHSHFFSLIDKIMPQIKDIKAATYIGR